MRVNPYGEDPLRLAVSLVNEPPHSAPELDAICRAAGVVIERPVTEHTLQQTRGMLDDWLEIVDEQDERMRAERLNSRLAAAATVPSITDHDGQGWHLHYRDDDLDLADILRTMIFVGSALHFVTRGIHRLGRCAAEDCTRVYVDLSRPGTQRYCSTACANRDAVRRHRARTAG